MSKPLSQMSDAELRAALQENYDRLNSVGVFKDPRYQPVGHKLRAAGLIHDPTQGGAVAPNTAPAPAPAQQTPAAPPQPARSTPPPKAAVPPGAPVNPSDAAAAAFYNTPMPGDPPRARVTGRGVRASVPLGQPAPAAKPSLGGFVKNVGRNAVEAVAGLGAFPFIVAHKAGQGVQSLMHGTESLYHEAAEAAAIARGDQRAAAYHRQNKMLAAGTAEGVNKEITSVGVAMAGGEDGIIGRAARIAGHMDAYYDQRNNPAVRAQALKDATALANTIAPGVLKHSYENPVEQVLNILTVGEVGASAAAAKANKLMASAQWARSKGKTTEAAKLEKAANGLLDLSQKYRDFSNTAQNAGMNKALPAAGRAIDRKLGPKAGYQKVKGAAAKLAASPVSRIGMRNTFEDIKSKQFVDEAQHRAEGAAIAAEIRTAARMEQKSVRKNGKNPPNGGTASQPGAGGGPSGGSAGPNSPAPGAPPSGISNATATPQVNQVTGQTPAVYNAQGHPVTTAGTPIAQGGPPGPSPATAASSAPAPSAPTSNGSAPGATTSATPDPNAPAAPIDTTGGIPAPVTGGARVKLGKPATQPAPINPATAAESAPSPTAAPVDGAPTAEAGGGSSAAAPEPIIAPDPNAPAGTVESGDADILDAGGEKKRPARHTAHTLTQRDWRAHPEANKLPKDHHLNLDPGAHDEASLAAMPKQHLIDIATALGAPKSGARQDLAASIKRVYDMRSRLRDATVESLEQMSDRELVGMLKTVGASQFGNKKSHAQSLIKWRDKARAESRRLVADSIHHAAIENALRQGRADELYKGWETDYPGLADDYAPEKAAANALNVGDSFQDGGTTYRIEGPAENGRDVTVRMMNADGSEGATANFTRARIVKASGRILSNDFGGGKKAVAAPTYQVGGAVKKGARIKIGDQEYQIDGASSGGAFLSGRRIYKDGTVSDSIDNLTRGRLHDNGYTIDADLDAEMGTKRTEAKAKREAEESAEALPPDEFSPLAGSPDISSRGVQGPDQITHFFDIKNLIDNRIDQMEKAGNIDAYGPDYIALVEHTAARIKAKGDLGPIAQETLYDYLTRRYQEVIGAPRSATAPKSARAIAAESAEASSPETASGSATAVSDEFEHTAESGDVVETPAAAGGAAPSGLTDENGGGPLNSDQKLEQAPARADTDEAGDGAPTAEAGDSRRPEDFSARSIDEETGEYVYLGQGGKPGRREVLEGDDKAAWIRRQQAKSLTQGGRGAKMRTAEEIEAAAAALREQRISNTAKYGDSEAAPHMRLADKVSFLLDQGLGISWRELARLGDSEFGGSQASGAYDARALYDALEVAVNQHIARKHPNLFDLQTNEAMHVLRGIMEKLPTQTNRTQTQQLLQQFSTPPIEAYVAVRALGNVKGLKALEPSAGTGSLATMLRLAGAEVVVNEHHVPEANLRAELLKQQGFTVTRRDGEALDAYRAEGESYDIVAMNPPFSATGGRTAHNKTIYGARHVTAALKMLTEDGRLVAIVGRGMSDTAPSFVQWFRDTRERTGYRANLLIDGSEYHKYGTDFDNRILVFDKSAPKGSAERAAQPGRFTDEPIKLDEAARRLENLGNEYGTQRASTANGLPAGARVRTQDSGVRPSGEGGPKPGVDAGGTKRPADTGARGADVSTGGARVRAASGSGESPIVETPGPGPGPDGSAGDDSGRGGPGDAGEDAASGGEGVPAADDSAGDGGGVHVEPEAAADLSRVDKKKVSDLQKKAEDDTFKPYVPEISAGNPHPSVLVETGSMGGVKSPLAFLTPEDVQKHIHFPAAVLKEGRLSDAQLEPIVMAQMRHTTKLPTGEARGYFVGDGTGVGKGRTTAGIILNNWSQGHKRAVWFSANHKSLAGAANNDLGDVAGWSVAPTERTAGKAVIPSFTIDEFPTKKAIDRDEGVLIVSYDTLGIPERLAQVTQWLRAGKEGTVPIMLFDEAHKGANAVVTGRAKASRRGEAMIKIQNALPDARVTYLTATAADKIQNLGYAVRLGLWGDGTPFPNFNAFSNFIEGGGLGAMEMVAREMKMMGAYTRRAIAFRGPDGSPIKYKETMTELHPEMITMYDKAADQWRRLMAKMESLLEDESLNKDEMFAFAQQYWGAHQRFFKGLITAFKAPTILKEIEDAMTEGFAPVVTLESTGEGLLKEKAAQGAIHGIDADDMDFSNKDALRAVVNRMFPTQLYQEVTDPDTGKTKLEPVWKTPDVVDEKTGEVIEHGEIVHGTKPEGGIPVEDPNKVALKNQVLQEVGELQVPGNLLDQIILHFGHNNVAELTGRKVQLTRNADTGAMEIRRRGKPRGSAGKDIIEYEMMEFNAGRRQVAVISRAAAQGISLHASPKFANKKPRRQILGELGWQTKEELQKLGRTHRAGQLTAPEYVLSSIGIGGEKRFSSALAANLAAAGAVGSGDRSAAGAGELAKYDYNSTYGFGAARKVFSEIEDGDLSDMSLTRSKVSELDGEDLITNLFNRLLVLPIRKQNAYFAKFTEHFERSVKLAKMLGTFESSVADIHAEKIVKVRESVVYTDPGSGAKTLYYELEATRKNNRLDYGQLKADTVAEEGDLWRMVGGGVAHVHFFTIDGAELGGGVAEHKARVRRPNGVENVYNAEYVRTKWKQVQYREDVAELVGADVVEANRDKGGYSKTAISEADKEKLWTLEYQATPPTRQDKVHVISGITFPIINRLHGDKKVVRVPLEDGERVVGLQLSEEGLTRSLRDLGVGADLDVGDPASVLASALEMASDEKIELAGGVSLKPGFFQGAKGLEIVDSNSYGGQIRDSLLRQRLINAGAIQTGKWGDVRLFIPTQPPKTGEKVLKDILDLHKIVGLPKSMAPKKGAAAAGTDKKSGGPIGSGGGALPMVDPFGMGLAAAGAVALAAGGYALARKFFTRDWSVAIRFDEAIGQYIEAGAVAGDRAKVLDGLRKEFGWTAGDEREVRFLSLVQKTNDFEEQMGRELVKVGLISKETFDDNRGHHLRRVYAYFENPDAWMRALEAKLKKAGTQDGLVTAALNDERQRYEKMTGRPADEIGHGTGAGGAGSRVKPRKFRRSLDDADPRDAMIRDFLGEIALASTRVERGAQIAAREVAKTRVNKTVARGLGVSAQRAAKLRELRMDAMRANTEPADTEFRTPGERLYFYQPQLFTLAKQGDGLKGATNYFIPSFIHRELMNASITPAKWKQIAGAGLTLWKMGKTVASVGAWSGNVLGNVVLSQGAGMLPMAKPARYSQAMTSMKKKDLYWRLAEQVAEYPYENFRMELPGKGDLPTAAYPQTPGENIKAMGQKAADRVIDGYGSIDTAFKHALFIDKVEWYRKLGMSDLEAARQAAKDVGNTYPNFRTGTPIRALRPTVQYLRRGWMPFISWDASAIPLVARAFRDHPGRMALFPLTYAAYKRSVDEMREEEQGEEAKAREDAAMPDYIKQRFMRLPGKDADYVDITPANPVGNTLLVDHPLDAIMQRMNPLLTLGYEVYTNRAFINDMPIYSAEGDLGPDKVKKVGAHVGKALAPTPIGFGADQAREVITGRANRPITETGRSGRSTARTKLTGGERVERALAATGRYKVRHMDVEREVTNRYIGAKAKLQATKSVLRGKLRDAEAERGGRLSQGEIKKMTEPYERNLARQFSKLPK